MWLLLAASASASCLNLAVSPSECVGGQRVRVTVDCDGGPVPDRWDVELQQDGGDYGNLVELGELVGGVAEGVCVDPGLPCDGAQTSYVYAVATDGEGGQEWAYARLQVKGAGCAPAEADGDTRDAEGAGSTGLVGPEDDAEPELEAAAAEEDEAAAGCGGGGLASAGLLLLALGRPRRR